MGFCDITCYSSCFVLGAFFPSKIALPLTVTWMSFLRRKRSLFYFFLASFPSVALKSKPEAGLRGKIAATEKNSVISVPDAFLSAWSEKQTC